MPEPVSSPAPGRRWSDAWPRLVQIYQREIWQPGNLKDHSLRGYCYAVLRVLSITVTVFFETRVVSRAAALGFSSLLGLGPLLAIAVLVAGFALGKNDPEMVADALNNVLKVVAPQLQTYEYLTQSEAEVNPRLVDIINNIINASRSGSAGAFGGLSLVLIVLLLFKSIEDTFNDIWGVRQGRAMLTRIVVYWTILTLGALLFFTAIALLGAGTFVSLFAEKLPGGPELLRLLRWILPVLSFGLLTGVLTLFYRVIPNTRVFWRAAFAGALVVGALAVLNNFLAFLYVKRVLLEKSLYGGLALPLVVMSGLYIFWLCVLTGGIVSYAVQNVRFRNSQVAWSTMTETMRERLALVVFLTICRRFRDCLPPVSASHLSTLLKVPTQLLNECLNRLVQMRLVTTLRPDPGSAATDYLYQPARPLNRMTLYDFKTLDDNFGEDPIGASLGQIDPILGRYDAELGRFGEQAFFQKTLEQLLEEHPFDDAGAPAARPSPPA